LASARLIDVAPWQPNTPPPKKIKKRKKNPRKKAREKGVLERNINKVRGIKLIKFP